MKHPQHKAMGFEQSKSYYESPFLPNLAIGIGFESNKYTSSEKSRLWPPIKKDQKACISSRITTVIHVVKVEHQINDN